MPVRPKDKIQEGELLTDKQDRFCREYLIDLNGTQAAIRAGYSEKTAKVIATQNLSKLYIRAKIEYYKNNIAEALNISALTIAREHQKIAFVDDSNLANRWLSEEELNALPKEVKAAIKSITYKVDRAGDQYAMVTLYDKQKSLDSLTAMTGFNAPIKTEVNARVDINPFDGVDEKDIASLLLK